MEALLDTNILVEILKNNHKTIYEVEQFEIHYISTISAMELYYGALNKQELNKIDKFINIFNLIHIDQGISTLAKKLSLEYAKSHSLDIPDALIAATSISTSIPLLTYNKKDFRFIKNLQLC